MGGMQVSFLLRHELAKSIPCFKHGSTSVGEAWSEPPLHGEVHTCRWCTRAAAAGFGGTDWTEEHFLIGDSRRTSFLLLVVSCSTTLLLVPLLLAGCWP